MKVARSRGRWQYVLVQRRRQHYVLLVRELENRVEQLVALSGGGVISEEIEFQGQGPAPSSPLGLRDRVEAFERGLILEELKRCGGNRSEAARRLKIGRVTLLDKLRKYGAEH